MKLANTKKQSLLHHSIGVAMLSENLFKKMVSQENYEHFLEEIDFPNKKRFSYEKIKNTVFYAGLFHDIGKLDENFQQYIYEKIELKQLDQEHDIQIEKLKKNKIDIYKYPLHNEISFAVMSSLFATSALSEITDCTEGNIIENIAYFHHAKIMRDIKYNFDTSNKILTCDNFDPDSYFNNLKVFLSDLVEYMNKYCNKELNIKGRVENLEKEDLIDKNISVPVFQSGKLKTPYDLFKSAITHLLRSIVVSADRIISGLSENYLEQIIQNSDFDCLNFEENININDEINNMLDGFNSLYPDSERSKAQSIVAKELSDMNNIGVLKGPAGVGKTKIMFEYIRNINNGKRTFIIVPKTSIAQSLYQEISNEYLTRSAKVEIVIGELKEISQNKNSHVTAENELFSGDVVITTIDQILNMMLGHLKIDIFLEILNSNLIFDEFHEFLYIPAISMLFIEIIYLKHILFNQSCLLVSATPNYFLLEKLYLRRNNVKTIKSFNNTKYKINLIKFEDGNNHNFLNEMFDNRKLGEICIFNTATKAQLSAIKAINQKEKHTLVFHSKFNRNDRREIFERIIKEFGKKGQTKNNVLRVGPILQASVDISTKHMLTEISNIDNIYQRLGRVVRWNETNDGLGEYSIFIPDDFKKTGSIRSGLNNVNCLNSAIKFSEFIEGKIQSDKLYTLNELYEFYDEFFLENRGEITDIYQSDFNENIAKSIQIFEQNFEPVKIERKKETKNEVKKLPKKSLRGNSMFCYVFNYEIDFNNQCKISETKELSDNIVSMSLSDFYGIGNFNKYLEESRDKIAENKGKYKVIEEINENIKKSSYIAKKNISKMPANWFINFARNEEMPILLSYKNSVKKISNEDQYFNLIYKNVKIGIIKKSNYK